MASVRNIQKKDYQVLYTEYPKYRIEEYCNLKLYHDVGEHERLIGLLKDLSQDLNIQNLLCINSSHGGFIPINCREQFLNTSIILEKEFKIHTENIANNIWKNSSKNKNNIIQLIPSIDLEKSLERSPLIFIQNDLVAQDFFSSEIIEKYAPVILTSSRSAVFEENYQHKFILDNSPYTLYIPNRLVDSFYEHFHYYLDSDNKMLLKYDNLINLCIMVKNGGAQFESMLQDNIELIDRWTILDTGSTDGTQDIVRKVLVGKKKGALYEEPFINFRDSRNNLLDYADKTCKYTLMLDDTYVIEGKLREFLRTARDDQYSDSFTMFIESDDSCYGSNRIVATSKDLRYIHKIHEVITDKNNINVVIPKNVAKINDRRFDYMEKRTSERKDLDLKLLFEEVEENSQDPRAYYYLAQTYTCKGDYQNAYKYFLKRAEFRDSGFRQELVDALFEGARTANFKLNLPWEQCEKLYLEAHKVDETRPDSMYFIGIHYYLEGQQKKAHHYFKKAFEIGFPVHTQYSLKPTLSYHFVPYYLSKTSYFVKDYSSGLKASEYFLMNNKKDSMNYEEIVSWYNIYKLLNEYKGDNTPRVPTKPILCFVAPGGFNKWSGKNIYTTGVGGSETYIIELARHIAIQGQFDVYVFCDCEQDEEFEGVNYRHLSQYSQFINTTYVHTCIVSRFSEYLPLTFRGYSENVYLVCHDLTPSGIVIPMEPKLKKIFCLTEWHVEYMTERFPQLKDIIVPFYYGIDASNFTLDTNTTKVKNSFIYSSFANRGLLPLLQMWPKIYEKYPDASLHIYCDLENKWLNDFHKKQVILIKKLFDEYNVSGNGMNIFYHGWVDKKSLAKAWKSAEYWFYPCIFLETFCLTALEAALTKTMVITNGIGALENTVGNRGIVIKGDPMVAEWQKKALEEILRAMDPGFSYFRQSLIDKNYEWASNLTWKNQAKRLIDEYILPNKLEYKGMYNWTNDLPAGHKQIFLEVINYFNNNYVSQKNRLIKILEVGSYSGISLCSIVKAIPNSIGIGVDMWKSYEEEAAIMRVEELEVEKSFYKNIQTEGLQNRITGIKSDSTNALANMIKRGEMFDFIYVDGSHTLLDSYTDLIMAWHILEKGGVLAFDDYLFNYGDDITPNEKIMERTFEGVNYFLKRFEGQYNILHKGYRLFLEKI